MKCSNCGAELQEGTLFCSECGTKIIVPESQAPAANEFAQNGEQGNMQNNFGQPAGGAFQNANFQQPGMGAQNQGQSFDNIYAGVPDPAAPVNNGNDGAKKGGKGIKKILIPVIILLVLVAAAVGGIMFYLNSRPIEVDLKEYVEVKFDGYDTLGTATLEFDESQFKKDFGEKLKYHGEDKDMKDTSAKKLIAQYLDEAVSLDKTEKLTNGDKVTVKFKYDAEALLEDLNLKTTTDGITFEVKGLEEVPTFDPFEGLEITYYGIAPDAYGSLDDSNVTNEYFNDYDYYFNYDYEQLEDLSNGDVITITIKWDETVSDEEFIEEFVTNYGAMPTQLSKDFTVEGLNQYVTKADQITEDVLGQIQSYLEDQELVYTSDNIGDEKTEDGTVTISNVEYYGMYVGEPKADSYYDSVDVYVTYKITLKYKSEEYSYYHVVEVDDVVLDGDGNLVLENISYSTYNYEYLRHDFKDGSYIYGIYGYETTADIEDDLSYYSSYYNFKWVLAGENASATASTEADSSDEATEGASEEAEEAEAEEAETDDAAESDSAAEGASEE